MKRIAEGDSVPRLELDTNEGKRIALGDMQGRQPVVVFFYPKDGTPGCTREACSFRDAYEQFAKAGAVVIGISGDSEDSHRKFAAQHNLPFHLVSDTKGEIRKAFGVPKTLGLLPGRVTYVIGPEGIVRLVFNSQLDAERHVERALEVVEQLSKES
ncbi:MAG: peroxiredoxin [Planctomycetes bacterium]|nr:peroxiredoxin [Planctomycetota bacterium]